MSYINSENDFTIEFSRTDRNIMSEDGMINGTISNLESEILEILRKDENITVPEMAEICKKSSRTISRAIAALKSKKLIERIGSNKVGSWKVK
ncbi:MAG: winged helix-turn-helix transcriptional regulator [Lachnospiraceae bacterium]|nr:winged helix-turn-helix transcriptional regulator [Lachnospiraceae bacterium]